MAEINRRPFIHYLFDQLIDIGLSRVIVSTGYLKNYFSRELGTKYGGLEIFYSEEQSPLGTGGALKLAAKQLMSDNVLVMNGDSYLEVDFMEFLSCHCRWQSEVTMALTAVNDTTQFGRVEMGLSGRIIRFQEKWPDQINSNWVNAGKYFIQKDTIQRMPTTCPLSLERDLFPALVGKKFFGYKTRGKFIDIGTPHSFQQAQSFFDDLKN
jgi:D-glycero-alpha-D-manno-heptose 1-phosphate guanylyltransferase